MDDRIRIILIGYLPHLSAHVRREFQMELSHQVQSSLLQGGVGFLMCYQDANPKVMYQVTLIPLDFSSRWSTSNLQHLFLSQHRVLIFPHVNPQLNISNDEDQACDVTEYLKNSWLEERSKMYVDIWTQMCLEHHIDYSVIDSP